MPFDSRAVRRAALASALAVAGAAGRLDGQQASASVAVAQAVASARAPMPADSAGRARKRPFASLSASAQALRDSIVAMARAQVGTPYVLGGTAPALGFDCSGLVKFVMAALRIDTPRTAREQATFGRAVHRDLASLKPGDLVTFGSRRNVSHIGIYVGDGRVVHASTGAGRVIETPLVRLAAPGIKPWVGVRRVAALADTGSAAR